ncbi:EAL domain-containing protein [Bradyrhizobium sp. LHD-71]|uniref:bifunctional diguanylate cyclase/phosphodiesterase n=1 Tax=Bradyrhizobium sp. LHD-71 TaxID=3072141 RepID=UPI0028102CC1|nr:EAL domain-containing protein [Bradyrhizobium sp. LHD-71]MDQ8729504.1 EAL domain-containing protein [Bradyrhizobium sp. LHD-71]
MARGLSSDHLRRGPILALALGGAILVAAIAVATAAAVFASRDRAISASERELENNARLLSRHIEQTLTDFVFLQKVIVAELELEQIESPETFKGAMGTQFIHRMLASKVMSARDLVGVSLWTADGEWLNSSQTWPVGERSIAQRNYFRALKSNSAGTPLLIELIRSQFIEGHAIIFAQRIVSPNGVFLGLTTRALSPKSFEHFFASVALDSDAAFSLFHSDGTLITRFPHADPLPQPSQNPDNTAAVALWSSTADEEARFAAPAQVGNFPLRVVVSTSADSALGEWRKQTRLLVVAALLSSLVISLTLFMIIRQLKRQYDASRQRLTLEKQRLDTAVNNMTHGLLLFDSNQRLVLSNDRYIEMFDVSRDVVKPGCTLRELIQHRKDRGSFHGDVDQYCALFIDGAREGKTKRATITGVAGRIVEVTFQPLPQGGWVTTLEDITDRRRSEERIAHLAHYDPLTELPNRLLFRERLGEALRQIGRDSKIAVLYIDIDGFKTVNDSLGHSVGDELLKGIAGRLRECLDDDGVVARLGGDEFAIIRTGVTSETELTGLIERIYQALHEPFECMGHRLMTGASIGIALGSASDNDLEQLVKNADLAMYDAKAGGRRTFRFFDPALEARAKARHLLERDLRQAVAEGSLDVYYQPVVDLRSERIVGCEALVRWFHPERGCVSPAEFIPIAEDIGLIDEIGEWVLNTACIEATGWPAHVKIAVNVSPMQFRSRTLPLKVASVLARSGLPAERLELEITEAVLIHDHDTAFDMLDKLRSLGVSIALDDFGTGYSSLSYLHRFRFDKIKIDRSFISSLSEDKSLPILQAALGIAASQRMITTAEGVETEAQRRLLRELGCAQMQGHLFSPARTVTEIRKLLRDDPKRIAASA